jgi:hypothetical protein
MYNSSNRVVRRELATPMMEMTLMTLTLMTMALMEAMRAMVVIGAMTTMPPFLLKVG